MSEEEQFLECCAHVAFDAVFDTRKNAVRDALVLETIPSPRLARLVLRARFSEPAVSRQRRWAVVLDDALSRAIHSKTRGAKFAEAAVQYIAECSTKLRGISCVTAIKVTSSIITDFWDEGLATTMPDWLTTATTAILTLLEGACWSCKPRVRQCATHQVERILMAHQTELLPLAVRVVTSDATASRVLYYAQSLIVRLCVAHASELFESEHKSLFLQQYLANAFGKEALPSEALGSFTPLLESLSISEVNETLESVARVMKKSPETTMEATAMLAEGLRFDLSVHILDGFLPLILRQLRSAKDEARALAARLLRSLAKRCGDAEVLTTAITEHGAILAGKSGLLAQWFQRHGMVCGLEELRHGAILLAEPLAASTAAAAASALAPIAEKESHEETKMMTYITLGKWLALADSVPSAVEAILRKALSNTKVSPLPALRAMWEMSSNAAIASKLEGLEEAVVAIVTAAQKRSIGANPEAVIAAATWLRISAASPTLQAKLSTNVTFTTLFRSGSFLFSASLLQPNADPHIAAALLALCAMLSSSVTEFG